MKSFKAGTWSNKYEYKSFCPSLINTTLLLDDPDLLLSLSEANRLIGELNAYSRLIPDVNFFIQMHVLKEATQSSKIEGTKTEFDEALLEVDEIVPERRDDWTEVQNYTKAMNFAISELEKLPLSMRLLNKTHEVLLSGVRGEQKTPGEIRRSQNWIGGSSPKDAFFVPPHQDELPELLSDLEKYWHNEELRIPELIKAAVSHYQLETIHPYLDGNGRIGRLLITLYLIEKKILNKPVLYLSDFFARNKGSYYDALTAVRHSNNMKHWLIFFLNGVQQTARSSIQTFEEILKLRDLCEEKVLSLGKRAPNARALIMKMYSKPMLDINQVASFLDITHQSASSLIKAFEEIGLVSEITGFKRNKLYAFGPYLKIFNS